MRNKTMAPDSSGGYNYPAEPRKQVIDLVELLDTPKEILDIGAGFGNNCELLLERGHIVTATETNPECISYLTSIGARYPGQLTVVEETVQQLGRKKTFDAVICTMVLHFVTEEEAAQAIETMQGITRPGGYNVLTNYLKGQDLTPEYTWLTKPREIRDAYSGWKIIGYEETYPFGLSKVRTARQLARWLLGKKGYKSARLLAQR